MYRERGVCKNVELLIYINKSVYTFMQCIVGRFQFKKSLGAKNNFNNLNFCKQPCIYKSE